MPALSHTDSPITVNPPLVRHLLLTLCLATGPGLLAASEKAPAVTPPPAQAQPADKPPSDILALPKMEVTVQRIKKLDKMIAKLDKMIAREMKKVKSSELDKALNNAQVARAAAIFGGNSAEHLSAVAATRVALLENERDVLEAMKRPATLEELAMLEAEVDQLRLTRRNLDDAAKQR